MGKLSKRKRLQQQQQQQGKRSLQQVEDDEDRHNFSATSAADYDSEDDSDNGQAGDAGMMMGGRRPPKIGAALSANIRDMEHLEMARLEREKRKDPNFQKQRRAQAQQRKRELEMETDPSLHRGGGEGGSCAEGKGAGGNPFEDDLAVTTFEEVTSGKALAAAASAGNSLSGSTVTTRAMFSHASLELSGNLVRALENSGYTHLTMIQERVIPFALQDHDILGQARTGQGKTLAFCVPILQGLILAAPALLGSSFVAAAGAGGGGGGSTSSSSNINKLRGCLSLMIAPTKELAHQINTVLGKLTEQLAADKQAPLHITSELVTGGTKVQEETRRLLQANVVVGTVGRIADHVKRTPQWNLAPLKYFVLDEVDRMLTEGFREALDSIIACLPQTRQTLLFSATSGIVVQQNEENIRRLGLARTPLLISEKLDQPRFLRRQDAEVFGEIDYIAVAPVMPSSSSETSKPAPAPAPAAGAVNSAEVKHQQLKQKQALAKKKFSFGGDDENDHDDDDEDLEGDETEMDLSEKHVGQDDDDDDDDDDDQQQEEDEQQQQVSNVPSTLEQYVQIVRTEDRLRALYVFMKRVAKTQKSIVFCSTVASATFHCMMMGSVGFHDEVLMLHGKMKHRQRLQVFQAFREWETGVLFCTDVAARGLDIPRVGWVLQLDPPVAPREYIHRIGRTARAGAAGKSLIFLRPEERGFIDYMRRFDLQIQLMTLSSKLPDIQHRLEHVVEVDPPVARAANQAYSATIGAYESHELKTHFDPATLLLKDLAKCFALGHVPLKGIKKMDVDEEFDEDAVGGGAFDVDAMTVASRNKKNSSSGGGGDAGGGADGDYVKGRFKSLHRRKMQSVVRYHREKTKKQWTDDGKFVGMRKPNMKLK